VPTPKTSMFDVVTDIKEVAKTVRDKFGFPVVFKPSDGVSCGGLSVIRNEEQVAGAVAKVKAESLCKHFLVQELVEGAATSVSLLSTGDLAVPLSLNQQDVVLEAPEACSCYRGGVVPFDHPRGAEAFEMAEKLVKSVPGLRGYVGVDFVLIEEAAVVVEVNPRLTTSYVGLRRGVNFNPAQAIANAVLKSELPSQIENCGYTCFSKVETPNPTRDELRQTYGLKEVVSPPFPFSETSLASTLIASHGSTVQEATSRFREAKKRVLDTISRGK
jgi:predicted ATP-grasp superfamily ATP-dependent carboligase